MKDENCYTWSHKNCWIRRKKNPNIIQIVILKLLKIILVSHRGISVIKYFAAFDKLKSYLRLIEKNRKKRIINYPFRNMAHSCKDNCKKKPVKTRLIKSVSSSCHGLHCWTLSRCTLLLKLVHTRGKKCLQKCDKKKKKKKEKKNSLANLLER